MSRTKIIAGSKLSYVISAKSATSHMNLGSAIYGWLRSWLIILSLVFGAGNGFTAVIGFQDLPSGSCSPSVASDLSSGGFDFSGNPASPNLSVCDPGVLQNNTSAALINAGFNSILTMSASDGSFFSLQSFYAGTRTTLFDPNSESSSFNSTGLEVVGTYVDGTNIVETFEFDFLNWDQFTLSDVFGGLVSVTFTALGEGIRPQFLIDDIVVNEVVNVAEPGSFLLLIYSFFGMILLRQGNIFGVIRRKVDWPHQPEQHRLQ